MNYKEAIDWLYSQLPLFQKKGGEAYHPGLDNIQKLLAELGNPHLGLKAIHIAGTNGKGSVSHMLASVLQHAGYKVGLYTSPHLKNFEERVKINGKEISQKKVISFTQNMMTSSVKPSFFEMTVALAFNEFKEQQVDFAIIETGMGGRLDSTNVITPLLSIITNISLDHQQYLGDTLEKIAFEKAGIIKQNTPVVIGEYIEETKAVFINKAKKENAPITFAQDENLESYSSDLKGSYQTHNLRTALSALKTLIRTGISIEEQEIVLGLKTVQETTGLKGRFQTLDTQPKIIADTGHNLSAFEFIIPQLKEELKGKLFMVFGMANDKDCDSILKLLPKDAYYLFCKPNVPRGLDVNILKAKGEQHGLVGETFSSVATALKNAKELAEENDLIFIGGSTFVVAEVV